MPIATGPAAISGSRSNTTGERSILISVRDEGVGLPADFDVTKSRGLGTRLIMALAKQLDAEFVVQPASIGTHVALRVPLDRVANR